MFIAKPHVVRANVSVQLSPWPGLSPRSQIASPASSVTVRSARGPSRHRRQSSPGPSRHQRQGCSSPRRSPSPTPVRSSGSPIACQYAKSTPDVSLAEIALAVASARGSQETAVAALYGVSRSGSVSAPCGISRCGSVSAPCGISRSGSVSAPCGFSRSGSVSGPCGISRCGSISAPSGMSACESLSAPSGMPRCRALTPDRVCMGKAGQVVPVGLQAGPPRSSSVTPIGFLSNGRRRSVCVPQSPPADAPPCSGDGFTRMMQQPQHAPRHAVPDDRSDTTEKLPCDKAALWRCEPEPEEALECIIVTSREASNPAECLTDSATAMPPVSVVGPQISVHERLPPNVPQQVVRVAAPIVACSPPSSSGGQTEIVDEVSCTLPAVIDVSSASVQVDGQDDLLAAKSSRLQSAHVESEQAAEHRVYPYDLGTRKVVDDFAGGKQRDILRTSEIVKALDAMHGNLLQERSRMSPRLTAPASSATDCTSCTGSSMMTPPTPCTWIHSDPESFAPVAAPPQSAGGLAATARAIAEQVSQTNSKDATSCFKLPTDAPPPRRSIHIEANDDKLAPASRRRGRLAEAAFRTAQAIDAMLTLAGDSDDEMDFVALKSNFERSSSTPSVRLNNCAAPPPPVRQGFKFEDVSEEIVGPAAPALKQSTPPGKPERRKSLPAQPSPLRPSLGYMTGPSSQHERSPGLPSPPPPQPSTKPRRSLCCFVDDKRNMGAQLHSERDAKPSKTMTRSPGATEQAPSRFKPLSEQLRAIWNPDTSQ